MKRAPIILHNKHFLCVKYIEKEIIIRRESERQAKMLQKQFDRTNLRKSVVLIGLYQQLIFDIVCNKYVEFPR